MELGRNLKSLHNSSILPCVTDLLITLLGLVSNFMKILVLVGTVQLEPLPRLQAVVRVCDLATAVISVLFSTLACSTG